MYGRTPQSVSRQVRWRPPKRLCVGTRVLWGNGALAQGVLVAQALVLTGAAQSADSKSEFWPEFDFFIKLNEKSRIFLMYTATRTSDLDTYSEGQTGIHFDFYTVPLFRKRLVGFADKSRSKTLTMRAGYLLSRPRNASGASIEHMIDLEVTARFPMPGGLLASDRSRVDLRWVDGNPRQRYRNRLKYERTFDLSHYQFTPYVHGEVFYDFNPRRWNRFRFSAGAEWNITKRVVLEGYYLRQDTWASKPQFVNAVGTALQCYLR